MSAKPCIAVIFEGPSLIRNACIAAVACGILLLCGSCDSSGGGSNDPSETLESSVFTDHTLNAGGLTHYAAIANNGLWGWGLGPVGDGSSFPPPDLTRPGGLGLGVDCRGQQRQS